MAAYQQAPCNLSDLPASVRSDLFKQFVARHPCHWATVLKSSEDTKVLRSTMPGPLQHFAGCAVSGISVVTLQMGSIFVGGYGALAFFLAFLASTSLPASLQEAEFLACHQWMWMEPGKGRSAIGPAWNNAPRCMIFLSAQNTTIAI